MAASCCVSLGLGSKIRGAPRYGSIQFGLWLSTALQNRRSSWGVMSCLASLVRQVQIWAGWALNVYDRCSLAMWHYPSE